MSGNVYEWCWDWKAGYPDEAQNDPVGPSSGSGRMLRGGGHRNGANTIHSICRLYAQTPSFGDDGIGFRVVSLSRPGTNVFGTTGTFTSIAAFSAWLDSQPTNTREKPYNVKLNVSDLIGSYTTTGNLSNILNTNKTKYVKLDLSGSTITRIGESAFWGCTNLTSIIIPNSVTSMGGYVFAECINLTSVTIGNSVTSIETNTFTRCALTSVTIPASVTSIGDFAFEECTGLTSVTFAAGSNITDNNFGQIAFPEGNYGIGGNSLKNAYSKGKAGTYTRAANGTSWTRN